MRSSDSIFGSFGRWQDRVAEDDVFHRTPIEEIVGDAIEFAQIIVDAAIEPLIDLAADLSRDLGFHRGKDGARPASSRHGDAEGRTP